MSPLPSPTAANIEVKARVASLANIRDLAQQIATEHRGILEQCDTFFHCQSGRLKLRETQGQPAQLIWYIRADQAEVRKSEYSLVPCGDHAEELKQALGAALGIQVVVRKRRELLLHHHVRIHLDQVSGLGEFVELEAVLSSGMSEPTEQQRVSHLLEQLNIGKSAFESRAYADLLLKT